LIWALVRSKGLGPLLHEPPKLTGTAAVFPMVSSMVSPKFNLLGNAVRYAEHQDVEHDRWLRCPMPVPLSRTIATFQPWPDPPHPLCCLSFVSSRRRNELSIVVAFAHANGISASLSLPAALLHHHIPYGNLDRLVQSSRLRLGHLGSHRALGSVP